MTFYLDENLTSFWDRICCDNGHHGNNDKVIELHCRVRRLKLVERIRKIEDLPVCFSVSYVG